MTRLFQYVNYIDYDELVNKPIINHVVVEGDKTLADYGIQPAGNYAHLNANGKVPFEELDDSILGNLQYQGTWDAEHNNPNLPLVPAKKGQYWIVSHGGERFELEFETGDWIIAGDGVWQKIDNSDTVISVNGKRGVVVLNAEDIPYGITNVKDALDSKQHTLTAGKNIKIENNVISAEYTEAITDYNLLYNHPSINNVELVHNKSLEDFDIQKTIYAGQNVYLTKSNSQKMDDTINVYTATESRNGVSEIATQQETNTGTDDFRYITPKKLKPIRDALEQAIAAEETRAKGVEGSLSNLTTDSKGNLVSAINEVDSHSDSTASDLADEIARATSVEGTLSSLTTDDKTDLVSAINEVDSHTDTNTTNLSNHIGNTSNPHSVTKAQVGLSNVDNTSDLDKPISTATQTALDGKVSDVQVNGTSVVTNKVASISVPATTSSVTQNSTDALTSGGAYTALNAKQDKITGSAGEVVYHNGTNVFTQTLLNEGFVCMTASDVAICKNNSPSFADIFSTWKKFSHLNGENDAVSSEMSAWTYDSVNDTIVQPKNTTSYVGFISPKSYSSYDITVRCYSTGADDDSMGLVAAFATDGNGREHTLSFIRTPGGTGASAKWVCILDYTEFSLTATSYGQTIIVNNSSTTPTPSSTANWNTETIGVGTVINMTRSGNVITAACSQFNSTTVDENTRITIDLDTLSQTYPTLALFKGSSPWGYSNCSQANSMYENIAVTDPDGYIFDIPNNQVLQYSASTRTWNVVSGVTPIEVIGSGRFSYNRITGKLFYCTGTIILQIATNN